MLLPPPPVRPVPLCPGLTLRRADGSMAVWRLLHSPPPRRASEWEPTAPPHTLPGHCPGEHNLPWCPAEVRARLPPACQALLGVTWGHYCLGTRLPNAHPRLCPHHTCLGTATSARGPLGADLPTGTTRDPCSPHQAQSNLHSPASPPSQHPPDPSRPLGLGHEAGGPWNPPRHTASTPALTLDKPFRPGL